VRTILTETGLAPHCLELELTETFLMQDSQSTATVLRALKAMGVQLPLDDFGTGFSSLSHLKRFQMDTLSMAACGRPLCGYRRRSPHRTPWRTRWASSQTMSHSCL
jgi:hypothetical protein